VRSKSTPNAAARAGCGRSVIGTVYLATGAFAIAARRIESRSTIEGVRLLRLDEPFSRPAILDGSFKVLVVGD
jgi:hypothetical protein